MNECCETEQAANGTCDKTTAAPKAAPTQSYTSEDQAMRVKQFLSFILSNTYITPEIGNQIPDLKLAADSIFGHTSALLKERI